MLNDRTKLLHCYSAEQFAVWELHLYLDTHPSDKAAQRLLEQHMARSRELKKEFEDRFGPLTVSNGNGSGCEWLSSPWPWEKGG